MVQGYFRATFLAIFYFSFSDLLIFILRSFVLEYTIVQRVQQILFFSLRVYRPLFLVHYCIFSQPIIALEFLINFFASPGFFINNLRKIQLFSSEFGCRFSDKQPYHTGASICQFRFTHVSSHWNGWLKSGLKIHVVHPPPPTTTEINDFIPIVEEISNLAQLSTEISTLDS